MWTNQAKLFCDHYIERKMQTCRNVNVVRVSKSCTSWSSIFLIFNEFKKKYYFKRLHHFSWSHKTIILFFCFVRSLFVNISFEAKQSSFVFLSFLDKQTQTQKGKRKRNNTMNVVVVFGFQSIWKSVQTRYLTKDLYNSLAYKFVHFYHNYYYLTLCTCNNT